MEQNTEAFVRLEKQNGVGIITFFHPAGNSLPGNILKQMADAINTFDADPETKVMILQSAGDRAFCGGASFDELIAINDEATGKVFFSGFARVINAMRKSSKFIIARVQGKAVGGGVGLVAAADYCIALDKASVKLSELAVGIGPFVVGPAVRRKTGVSGFSQLAIDATEWRSAQWAKENGLYAAVYSDMKDVDAAISRLTEKLITSSPEAMKELKAIFWTGTGDWDELLEERAAISGRLVLSDFTHNAIDQFKKKIK